MRFGLWLLSLSFLILSSLASAEIAPRSYAEVQKFLRQVVSQNPGNAELFVLGQSDTGEPIEGVRVGSGPVKNLVVGTHHGNEYGSAEVAKGFAASIAAAPIQGQSVFVIPVLNISGYNQGARWEKRYDPNRDYPGPCGTEGPFRLKSTKALADFVDREQIVASATLHTFSPAVLYPWGISTRDTGTPYDDLFRMLTQAATVESGYQTGNSTELLYPADGTFEDYAYWKHGIWSLLFELGYSHSPNQGAIDTLVRVNVPGLRRMLEQAPRQRAENHAFTGRCDVRLRSLDRHEE